MEKRTTAITMTLTNHARQEWARFAQAAYNASRSDIGHRMSVAASRPALSMSEYDARSSEYRAWLVFNEFAQWGAVTV